jgi:NAD(P)-dependent dehydrogenase (short-subunit alcohol dehydrogenase family)
MTCAQQPVGSGFNAASTTREVIRGIDLHGKTAIITGGYAGLGLETTRILAFAGARVVVPARDLHKAELAVKGIAGVKVDAMDLIDPNSVNAFADKFLASGCPLHIVVNSAGIMALPKLTLDERGYEYHFATNHLGHFQLATRLLPPLRAARGARVVSVSAWAHRLSDVVYDDVHFARREYQPRLGYAQSKTANILFAVGLHAREKENGVRAYSLHPGSIVTELARNFTNEQLRAFGVIDENGRPIIDPSRQLKTVEQGAATQVWCATSPKLANIGGVFCENVEVANVVPPNERSGWAGDDSTRKIGVMPHAIDAVSADRLWTLSERMLVR